MDINDLIQHIVGSSKNIMAGQSQAMNQDPNSIQRLASLISQKLVYNPQNNQLFPNSPLHSQNPQDMAMSVIMGITAPNTKEVYPFSQFDNAVDIVKGRARGSLQDMMNAHDLIMKEAQNQMTPQEISQHRGDLDTIINTIQPRIKNQTYSQSSFSNNFQRFLR